ncbi:hypothetical protein CTAYLR_004583 [Chrysophaeum taylorii]|uniref:5-formyltetrahydrofolate cyclo-ligase n=1 Tax=Chrysophaeum taylorii TaxID=2483200 RepID=A0AAD7UDT8_9STRA|nr:hypothetical protein CTAYLR_004583 [Chrysophaeum taylorii]
MSMVEKREARKQIRSVLKSLSPSYLSAQSASACERLIATTAWREASTVTCYCSMAAEFQTRRLLEAAFEDRKRVFLPRVLSIATRDMRMLEASSLEAIDSWPKSKWGIPEPPTGASPTTLDLVVVPGVAFDARGGRLGQGAGFYDAWLASLGPPRPLVVALALDEQIVDAVPMDPHDIPIDMVLTPSGPLKLPISGI